MAQHEVHHGAHHLGAHEYSFWPLPVGMAVLLLPITFIAYFVWAKSMLALLLGGMSLALLVVGLSGWAYEFYTRGHEEGLGFPAMMFFIVSEIVIFGTMFAAFYMARVAHASQWKSWVPQELNLYTPLILTLILWTSSGTAALAEKFAHAERRGLSALFFLFTIGLGALFAIIHIQEWTHLWHSGFTLSSNMYGTGFYALTGIHTSHVFVGLIMMVVAVFLLLTGKITHHKGQTYVRATVLYWHFVDLMWLLVASSAYLIGSLV
ncbi:cytochrome c oxidase subunit III [Thermocrinis albus DSM 14484]|uniref:Cytochrome c oxidase subunit III n=1 Tax=Thermocrinis albus (strain DSM 14484 / JCM 11386 / HI 11/12) TaxID=638303 RepID=D3SN03_THEAH|nr:heme-copper oxidase subunit III [Thermocrinis albus]ADC90133.1 cytochrome c oxidase subunit III [Thermocrinis albus DSM 14484]